jgi:hypothetical protein
MEEMREETSMLAGRTEYMEGQSARFYNKDWDSINRLAVIPHYY